jgi:mannitol-1-phosphate 5-dehydrogenase
MKHQSKRTFVGFGFGPIQAGLFLYEAFCSKKFTRFVVAEIDSHRVSALRQARGMYALNIAHPDRIEAARVGPIEIYDPACEADRLHLIEAVAEAEELSTSVPSVHHYASEGPGSLHRILAEGLWRKAAAKGRRAVVYAAENQNYAAETLEAKVFEEIPSRERAPVRLIVRFLDTEIGKISGVVSNPQDVEAQGLAYVTPGEQRAFLVESFNRILISKIRFENEPTGAPFQRGISVFEEKEDLVPFKAAKIFGHNATHALAAYVGAARGVERMADLRQDPGIMAFIRNAFVCESGESLVRTYAGADPLFTPEAFPRHVDVLLGRMFNPFLCDTVQRVGRDPQRKLGWDDRLVGTMRLALRSGVQPLRHALGAAAALRFLDASLTKKPNAAAPLMRSLWAKSSPDEREQQIILDLIEVGRSRLEQWSSSGFPDLERLFEHAPPLHS